jgi:hypothetical protein
LSGTAGALIAVLDACLVNGFGLKSVDSVTVASGVATATISTGIGAFEVDAIVLIAGATPASLNGEKRILTTTANTITFDAAGIADQTATGIITAKLAPAGWQKQFSGTNLAAYRSADPASTQAAYRVDDSDAKEARITGYESMSDIDTGDGMFPSSVQVAGGVYWEKSVSSNGTVRSWTVVADGLSAYVYLSPRADNFGSVYFVGDIYSYKVADSYRCGLSGNPATSDGYGYQDDLSAPSSGPFFLSRRYTAVPGSLAANQSVESYGFSNRSGAANAVAVPAYPNGADNSLVLSRKIIYEAGSLRGVFPGLLYSVQNCVALFSWRDKVTSGARKVIAVKTGSPDIGGNGVLFLDITGSWDR